MKAQEAPRKKEGRETAVTGSGKQHIDAASQQAARRARQEEQAHWRAEDRAARPSVKRWAALIEKARAALLSARDEMETYHDRHSPLWQDSPRGEALRRRIDALDDSLRAINTVE